MIEDLINELSSIIEENKSLKRTNEMFRNQLIIVAMNGYNKNLDFGNLNEFDLDQVKIGIGNTGFHVLDEKNKIINSFEEIPKK